MVVFGAATGLRPAELVALERQDIDRDCGVVYARHQLARGQIKHTKTRRSVRAVPLQAAALEALDQLPESDARLFPAARGGYIDLHNFRARTWRPAQISAGMEPIRRPYDLCNTYATFALRAGISIFDLSRFMGRDSERWTSRGRRRSEPSPHPPTKARSLQALRGSHQPLSATGLR
jgi:integrase